MMTVNQPKRQKYPGDGTLRMHGAEHRSYVRPSWETPPGLAAPFLTRVLFCGSGEREKQHCTLVVLLVDSRCLVTCSLQLQLL